MNGDLMKKQLALLVGFFFVILFLSCNDEGIIPSKFKTNEKPKFTNPPSVDPSNSANPYDSAGFWHNEGLDYFVENCSNLNFDSTTFVQGTKQIVSDFYCGCIYDLPENTTCSTYAFAVVDTFFTTTINMSNEDIINSTFQDEYSRELMNELLQKIYDLSNCVLTTQTVENYVDTVKTWETEVIFSLNLSQTNKKILLGASSVARWSFCYWYDESSNLNSPWINCVQCTDSSIVKNRKGQGASTFSHNKKIMLSTTEKVIAVAVSDVVGFLKGGVVGSVTASAVTAVVVWWDEVCEAIDWLWNMIF
jgi:hypothetical protein